MANLPCQDLPLNDISSPSNPPLISEHLEDKKVASLGKLLQESTNLNSVDNTGFDLSKVNPAANLPASSQSPKDRSVASTEKLIQDIIDPNLRDAAMLELSKKREIFQDLGPLLWNSACTIAALLQEIICIYHLLSPPYLTDGASNRVCNALALLQCVASHPDTQTQFLSAVIPSYLYPFLETTSKTKPVEHVRLASLGVIGALVKASDSKVISVLLSAKIIPPCLRSMEMGGDLSKTVATFIVEKILLNDVGLGYISATPDRYFALVCVLGNMVQSVAEKPSQRLLKHIIRCYHRLSEFSRACKYLGKHLPEMFRVPSFINCLGDDSATKQCLHQLLNNVSGRN